MCAVRYRLAFIMVSGLVLLSACNLPSRPTSEPTDPSLVYTAAAQTVQAQLTQSAIGTAVVFPTFTPVAGEPTSTQALPTVTPIGNITPLPTATSVAPTATSPSVLCDQVSFVEDVTYPDDTELAPGTTFVKTWRLRNNGSCTWTSSYFIVFDSGDAMSGPASVQLTSGTVSPGSTVDVSVTLKAPETPGTYRGNWKLRNGAGATFGIGEAAGKPFWVQIKVVVPKTPTPTPTSTPVVTIGYDFITRGPDAEWRNAIKAIPWGDPPDDTPGVAVDVSNAKLEDGKSYGRVLATYPEMVDDGMVSGLYPSYTIQDGDHFRTILGLRQNCGDGKVRYQLFYIENNIENSLGDWVKTCDGNVLGININLSGLKGKTVQFKLIVKAEGSYKGDQAMWVNPRIER